MMNRGLKENVIVGRLIPAGTGYAYHQDRAVAITQRVKRRLFRKSARKKRRLTAELLNAGLGGSDDEWPSSAPRPGMPGPSPDKRRSLGAVFFASCRGRGKLCYYGYSEIDRRFYPDNQGQCEHGQPHYLPKN
ncbi:hypothetical protein M8494_35580 [Serratia ureilytica]